MIMMWLKYAGTIEIIIALSGMHEKVDEMLYLGGEKRGEEGRRNKDSLIALGS